MKQKIRSTKFQSTSFIWNKCWDKSKFRSHLFATSTYYLKIQQDISYFWVVQYTDIQLLQNPFSFDFESLDYIFIDNELYLSLSSGNFISNFIRLIGLANSCIPNHIWTTRYFFYVLEQVPIVEVNWVFMLNLT